MSDESLLAELKQQIASGNLVIIAGTGVSRPACDNQHVDGFAVATWPGLLQHGVVRCVERGVCDAEEASLLNLQIASKKTSFMVSAATEVSQRLKENPRSTGDYRHWLNDTIGELKPSSPAILHALDKIPALLATLNYDTLLEQATGRTAYTWQQDNQVGKVLRGELPRAVLHLHGVYDEPDSVVLGFDSYSRVKDAKHTQAILRYFTMGKTLLFVGCGATIEDPNFHQLLIWAREALAESAHKHYYLCHPSELVAKQQELPSWLRPLDYPDKDDFTGLLPFLQGLIPPPSPQTPPPALESQLGIEVTALEVAGEWGRALEIY